MSLASASPDRRRVGPYWLLAELDRGGMADVYLVVAETAVGLDDIVVLKQLKRDLAEEPEFVSMFLDEGRLATRLEHPNVVRTHEVAIEERRPYLVMEYLEGRSLHRLLHAVQEGRAAISPEVALFIVMNILAALEYAHGSTDLAGRPMRIVHRDVSPANILLGYGGEVKLADFGIAKASLRTSQTAVGVLKGKATFMAPEQMAGDPVDARADIFAAGIILWSVCAGRTPWNNPIDRRRGPPPPLGSVAPDAPPELERIVARAIQPAPADRYESAGEMLAELEAVVAQHGLRPAGHELSALLTKTFAAERAHGQAILRERLREVREASARPEAPRLPLANESVPPRATESVPPEPTSVSVRPAGARARARPIAAMAALIAGALLASAAFLFLRNGSQGEAASGVSPPPASALRAEADTCTVSITVVPETARIELDGEDLGNFVALSPRPRSDELHRIRVSAPGYHTEEHAVRFDRDRRLHFELRPAAPAADASP